MAYPPPPKSLFVPVNPEDDHLFQQKVKTIKAVITELEDENNLIAYKIAKTRRRIDAKKALLEAQQAPPIPEQRSFWGGRKSTAAATPASLAEAQAETKALAKGGRKKAAPKRKVKDTPLTTIEPLNARELEYLGNGRPPVDYTPDPGYTSATQDPPPQPQPQTDKMEVDELDDY